MAQLEADSCHNICAYLGLDSMHSPAFEQVISFLRRSRIRHAITVRANAYKDHQRQFWKTAEIDNKAVPTTIRARIHNRNIEITVNTIRDVLQFQDADEDPTKFEGSLIEGCFRRMRYDGDVGESQLVKSNLSPQWKYLMHVLIHCLSPRKGGYNACRISIQSAMVALTLNMRFNFSEMIFNHLKENITTRQHKFLMYPRFLQLMINAQLPNIPRAKADRIKMNHMTGVTLSNMLIYRKTNHPPKKLLFGHITNPDYVAPLDGRWKHANEHDGDTTDDEERLDEDQGNNDDDEGDDERSRGDPDVGTSGRRGDVDLDEDHIPRGKRSKRRRIEVQTLDTAPSSSQDQPTPKDTDDVDLKSLVIELKETLQADIKEFKETLQADIKELKESRQTQNVIIKAQQQLIEAQHQLINSLQSRLDAGMAGTGTSGASDGDH